MIIHTQCFIGSPVCSVFSSFLSSNVGLFFSKRTECSQPFYEIEKDICMRCLMNDLLLWLDFSLIRAFEQSLFCSNSCWCLFCDFYQATGGQKNISPFFMSQKHVGVSWFCLLFTCLFCCIVILVCPDSLIPS